jgi:hypothetical protein
MSSRPIYCSTCKRVHAVQRPQAWRNVPTIGDHLRDAGEALLGLLVLALCCVAIWLWMAILVAAS